MTEPPDQGAHRLRTLLAKRSDKHSIEYCGRNRCVTEAGETRSRVNNRRSCCCHPHRDPPLAERGSCADDLAVELILLVVLLGPPEGGKRGAS